MQRQQQRRISPSELRGVAEVVDPSKVGELVVKEGVRWCRRHYVVSSLWVLGLVFGACFRGVNVSPVQETEFTAAVQQAAKLEDGPIASQMDIAGRADAEYRSRKGWFFSCDDRCTEAKMHWQSEETKLGEMLDARDRVLRKGREAVGIWSMIGVSEVKRTFWKSVSSGNRVALRWLMFDAIFMGVSNDEGLFVYLLKLFLRLLVNMTMGAMFAFFSFLFNLYSIITSFDSSLLGGVTFFFLAGTAAFSFLTAYIGAILGGAGVGAVGLARFVINSALLDDRDSSRHQGIGRHHQD